MEIQEFRKENEEFEHHIKEYVEHKLKAYEKIIND